MKLTIETTQVGAGITSNPLKKRKSSFANANVNSNLVTRKPTNIDNLLSESGIHRQARHRNRNGII